MRSLRIAAASTAAGLALTATAALAQGGYPPGMPGYGPPVPMGAPYASPGASPYAPPGAVPGAYPGMPGMGPMMPPGMDPSQGAPMAGGYPAAPGVNPMMPPGSANSGGTPLVDPSQIYGSGSSQQGQPATDPTQASPGTVPGPTATGGMPSGPMMGPMGPMGAMGPMTGMPGGPPGTGAMPGAPPGMSSTPGMPPSPNGTGVNAVAGMPPLANAQSPAPPGSINPMAAAQQPVAGPSGVPSAQASALSQAQTPSNQNATQADTVHVTDTDSGGVALDPTPIRYPVNRPITWVNSSSSIIQIASEDNSTFDSGPLAPGDTYVFTPSLIGSFYYHDKLHPWVRGVLVATAAR